MNVARVIEKRLADDFFSGKSILLIGPRQVGKTTLIHKLLADKSDDSLIVNADDPTAIRLFTDVNTEQLRAIIGQKKIVFIDEAQRIPNIGITAKLIVDMFPDVQLILSGSSAFDLNQKTQEPLTGRKWTYHLWPVSWQEYENTVGLLKAEADLENRLVFGLYPDVLNHPQRQQETLQEITDSYLYKDLLTLGGIKKPALLQKLLEALAFQAGNEVSMREVGELIGADPKTVASYIELLEKTFVVFSLTPFSRNLRNEIKANRKIYFYDNGIRNAVIRQYQPLALRQDVGALWENFLISERLKANAYAKRSAHTYFWRTKQQQEVDYVEEWNGKIYGYEFKWDARRKVNFSSTFVNAYQANTKVINRGNFREFVSESLR
ncbi:MAG: ATP-binding protein [Cyclobacteriaceae bacterium]|nr:ATP-binding protein [Cyclobacteriaceae bacterium]